MVTGPLFITFCMMLRSKGILTLLIPDFSALRAHESTLRSGRCWTSATGTQHTANIRNPLIFLRKMATYSYLFGV